MKIALFDHSVTSNNAIGKCNLYILAALSREHDFTVFAVEFENPCPDRISWVCIPAMKRPLALLYLTYHVLAPLWYWWHRVRHHVRFDLLQRVESILTFGDVAYPHFCNRAYLRRHWSESRPEGLKGWLRWLDHKFRALVEPWVYRGVGKIVVPSRGLDRELASEYPWTRGRIQVVPNPVDIERMRRPEQFDRESFRWRLGARREDLVLVFVALGHFERKGLPALLGALSRMQEPTTKLVVVGGTPATVSAYRSRAERMGLGKQVSFTGMQYDVRPYLWAADAFVLPSLYEVFPLVCLDAAAAGLPLIVSTVNGVEEFVSDGVNGILVDHLPEEIARGLNRFIELSPAARRAMGEKAQESVSRYDTESFVTAWRHFYADQENQRS